MGNEVLSINRYACQEVLGQILSELTTARVRLLHSGMPGEMCRDNFFSPSVRNFN